MGATVLALYVTTIAPTTQFWDTSEYIAAANVLGIPHPPGNPLFVLLAHVWGTIPTVAHYALRINLFSAVCSALASVFLFLTAELLLRGIVVAKWPRYLSAFAGVLVGAASFTVWNQSNVNEKVYTLSLLSIALILWLTVIWADRDLGSKRDKLLVVIIYVLALSATNHIMGLLVIPAVVVYVIWSQPRVLLDWRVVTVGTAVCVVGLSVWLFLIVRAPHFPPINEGEPVSWQSFWDVVMRKQYAKPPVTERQADLASQIANYLQYFTWQFGFDWPHKIRVWLAVLFGGIGAVGIWKLTSTDKRAGVAQIALMATLTVVLVIYLNFKYGFSMLPDEPLVREVRERDYFFVASFQLWGVWVAMGLGTMVAATTRLLTKWTTESAAWNTSLSVLLLCAIPLVGNRLTASRSHETLARDFARDLLQSLEPYAIVITAGDNDQFPLWYAQEVEGVRRDVVTANLSLMNTTWHLKQIRRRPVFRFNPDSAPALYRARAWPAPEQWILDFGEVSIDSLPVGYRVDALSRVDIGNVRVIVQPGIMTRSDIATLQLINDNLGKRPIYFSRTTGGFADEWGLGAYLVGHGIARKLEPNPVVESDSVVFSPTLGWINVPRTRELLFSVYHPEGAARVRPRGWIDVPSSSILSLYAFMYAGFSEVLLAAGEAGQAQQAQDYAQRILYNIQYER